MAFGCLKSSSRSPSWTRNSFPGGKSHSPSMLFGPVLPVAGSSPYLGAAALPAMTIPASTPMVFPMQMSTPFQTFSVPVTVQQPSPAIQMLPQPVPVAAAIPPTYTVLHTSQAAPHVPSPIIQGSIHVPQPSPPQVAQSICHDHDLAFASSQYQEQQQQGSPGKFTVNLYVNTPGHRSRQLEDRSPSPTARPQLWEQQQQWQLEQQEQQQQSQRLLQQQQQQWQERQQYQQLQWQREQLQQRGPPQSARSPSVQPPTPSSININIVGPQPMPPGSTFLTTTTLPFH